MLDSPSAHSSVLAVCSPCKALLRDVSVVFEVKPCHCTAPRRSGGSSKLSLLSVCDVTIRNRKSFKMGLDVGLSLLEWSEQTSSTPQSRTPPPPPCSSLAQLTQRSVYPSLQGSLLEELHV
ncbi:hypothetical protein JOQ06_003578, partial [Pogonophryne albipinna]